MQSFMEFVQMQEMPLPADWDAKVFDLAGRYTSKDFKNALLYARERSQYLAKGSSRAVFKVAYEGRPTILKIAMNTAGIDQNAVEAGILFDGVMGQSRVIVPGIDCGPDEEKPVWIHQEFAGPVTVRKFEQMLGLSSYSLLEYMRTVHRGNPFEAQERYKKLHPNFDPNHETVTEFYELWGNLGFDPDILLDLSHIGNWGIYQNRLVVVDLGYNQDVGASHYNNFDKRPQTPRGWIRPKKTSVAV